MPALTARHDTCPQCPQCPVGVRRTVLQLARRRLHVAPVAATGGRTSSLLARLDCCSLSGRAWKRARGPYAEESWRKCSEHDRARDRRDRDVGDLIGDCVDRDDDGIAYDDD